MVFHDGEEVHQGEDQVAQQLAREVRVLCWVMTNPENHKTKVRLGHPQVYKTICSGSAREGDLGETLQRPPVHEL